MAKQYLQTVVDEDIQPQIICFDQGSKITLMSECHYQLYKDVGDEHIEYHSEQDLSFKKCWYYRTSMKNVRIESW